MSAGAKVLIIAALMAVAGAGTWAVMRAVQGGPQTTATAAAAEPTLTERESEMVDWYAEHVGALQDLVDEEYAAARPGATLGSVNSDANFIALRLFDLTNDYLAEVGSGLVGGNLQRADRLWGRVTTAVADEAEVMLTLGSVSDPAMDKAAAGLAQASADVGQLRAEIERLKEMQ